VEFTLQTPAAAFLPPCRRFSRHATRAHFQYPTWLKCYHTSSLTSAPPPAINRSMISSDDKSAITELAARYGATRVLLFGSSADPDREGADIDLAVEGVAPEDFFAFYGELLFGLSKPVDLIDLSADSKFSRLVRREAALVHPRNETTPPFVTFLQPAVDNRAPKSPAPVESSGR